MNKYKIILEKIKVKRNNLGTVQGHHVRLKGSNKRINRDAFKCFKTENKYQKFTQNFIV